MPSDSQPATASPRYEAQAAGSEIPPYLGVMFRHLHSHYVGEPSTHGAFPPGVLVLDSTRPRSVAAMDGLYTIEYFARMLKEKPRRSGPGWTPLYTLLHFWLFSQAQDHSAPCASTATTHSSTVRFLRLPRQVNLHLSQIGVRGPRA